jgi:T5orf172 domain
MATVYIFRDGDSGLFKFGKSKDLQKRFEGGKTFNPRLKQFDSIEVDDGYTSQCETYLHKSLRAKRYSGEFFAVTPEEAKAAMRDASAYFAEFAPLNDKVEALSKEKSDDRMLVPSEQERDLYTRYLEAREQQDKWAAKRELLENKLKIAIGTAAGLEGLRTWESSEVRRLDQKGLKDAEPDVYERWAKPRLERRIRLLHDPIDEE